MRFIKATLFFLLLGTIHTPMLAQTSTTLVIALPDWWEGQFDDALLDDFEAQYNDVEVVVNFISSDDLYFVPPQFDIADHVNRTLAYAQKADVLFTGSNQLSVESTRTGAYLDLSPLTITDTSLDINDFYPALWQSFQWEGGIWAIPVGGSLMLNIYDKNAFDTANLSYPAANWTLTNYADAARTLTTFKASGAVDVPGMNTYYPQPFFYSLLNRGIYDMTSFPETANLVDDDIVALLTQWNELLEEQVANPFGTVDYESEEVSLHVEETWRVTNRYMPENTDWQAALLPHGRAGLRSDGFAVSGGTDHPELSYALVMYLTQNPDIINFFFFDTPARQSMSGLDNEDARLVFGEKPPELRALLDEAIQNAIPISEMRYFGYLEIALQAMQSDGKSAEDALIDVQQLLNENLAYAQKKGAETSIIVESPAATPILTDGEIMLNFGMNTLISPIPNREDWDRVAQEFAESDLEVGLIDFNFDLGATAGYDCFYRQFNNLQSLSIEPIIPIEPFLNADPNFNRDDVLQGVLSQLTRDNQIWGMPLNVTPSILWVNTSLFEAAGIPIPDTTWTINEFVDALNRLDAITEDPPFSPRSFGGNYILNLIAAYGGILFDPASPDAIPDLNTEQNINAMRQALDLAREGLIEYDELSGFSGGGGGGFNTDDTPIYDATLSSLDFRFQQRREGVGDAFRAVLYPAGTQYQPLVMEVGGGYINSTTPYAEACYRWIAHLAEHPELFDGMPARRSQLEATQAQGDDIYQLYSTIDNLLDAPKTVIFPFNNIGVSAYYNQQWVLRVFDAYVLDDVELDTALDQSRQFIADYATCIDPIEIRGAGDFVNQDDMQNYAQQFSVCAQQVDPIFAELFGG